MSQMKGAFAGLQTLLFSPAAVVQVCLRHLQIGLLKISAAERFARLYP